MSEKVRIQFDFAPEAVERVDSIQHAQDLPTRAAVVRNALRVYEWFTSLDPHLMVEIREPEDGTLVYRMPVATLL